MSKIRVLIADDHAILRSGLRLLIGSQPDMEVVGEATDGADAVRKAAELRPDVLTLDLDMPGGSGIQAIGQVRQACPRVRVLVLTMHADAAYFRTALAAGASGYVTKSAADVELLTAIRAVHQGRIFADIKLTESGVHTALSGGGAAAVPKGGRPSPLSQREQEVLKLLAMGYTNQQAADRLYVSVKTVETYRARVVEKLGLRTRADLVRYAIETGLVAPAARDTPPGTSQPDSTGQKP